MKAESAEPILHAAVPAPRRADVPDRSRYPTLVSEHVDAVDAT